MPEKELTEKQQAALRHIPAIEQLLIHGSFLAMQKQYSRDLVTEALRSVVAKIRVKILSNQENSDFLDDAQLADLTHAKLEAITSSTYLPVINVTGTIIHTNLGRSLLSASACEGLLQAGGNYVNLEYNLERGDRGHRDLITEPLLQRLTGCGASTVVNNNAAAVLLTLNTLGRGKEVIVSRGELIEIGGAFRIPDVMDASGAILREGLISGITKMQSTKTRHFC